MFFSSPDSNLYARPFPYQIGLSSDVVLLYSD